MLPRATDFCVALSVLFRRAVCIYQSSVDVVASGRPAPGQTPVSAFSGDSNSVYVVFGLQITMPWIPTDHQIGTSAHAPQRPMVTCIMMGTVVPGPHGLLCH
ncbi:hypothetical protein TNCV_2643701 [Trichonephila clavipes]|nr:hypothetical protein TNCV_2643701 [Trichonephila clavipes]